MRFPPWLFPRLRSFLYGTSLPWKALKTILAHPVLIFLSLLPIAVTLVLYSFIISHLQHTTQVALTSAFASLGWNPQGWAAWGVMFAAKIVLFLVSALTFSAAASVAASPFNDFLAEKSEAWARPALSPVKDASFRAKLKLIGIDFLKTVAASLATVVAIVFSWLPVLNALALIVAFLLVTFQYISYPQTRRGLTVGDGLRFVWRHVFACLGFGATISLLFAVPLVASLAIPVAVVGGTLLVARAPGNRELPALR